MVKLKWGMEYKGYLVSVDGYMNMQVRAGEGEGGREGGTRALLTGGGKSGALLGCPQVRVAEVAAGRSGGALGEAPVGVIFVLVFVPSLRTQKSISMVRCLDTWGKF